MTTTPTSPPTFRDGIEVAAKWHDGQAAELRADLAGPYFIHPDDQEVREDDARAHDTYAAAIRAIPTPDTLPTGWNSDVGEAPRDGTKIDLWIYWPEHGVARRSADARWDADGAEGAGAWRIDQYTLDQYLDPPVVKAWMPLPPPPPGE